MGSWNLLAVSKDCCWSRIRLVMPCHWSRCCQVHIRPFCQTRWQEGWAEQTCQRRPERSWTRIRRSSSMPEPWKLKSRSLGTVYWGNSSNCRRESGCQAFHRSVLSCEECWASWIWERKNRCYSAHTCWRLAGIQTSCCGTAEKVKSNSWSRRERCCRRSFLDFARSKIHSCRRRIHCRLSRIRYLDSMDVTCLGSVPYVECLGFPD